MTSERFVEMPEMHSALLVSPLSEDRDFLEKFFLEKGWELHATPTGSSALAVLRERKIPVVITERDLPVGDWKDLLVALQQLPYNPFLVVTSRIAHEHLWAEVLNLGGHDVVAKPFQAEELHWSCRVPGGAGKITKNTREILATRRSKRCGIALALFLQHRRLRRNRK
jgi:CheY-like chemotaxis protein